jgi:hypothetical protein
MFLSKKSWNVLKGRRMQRSLFPFHLFGFRHWIDSHHHMRSQRVAVPNRITHPAADTAHGGDWHGHLLPAFGASDGLLPQIVKTRDALYANMFGPMGYARSHKYSNK